MSRDEFQINLNIAGVSLSMTIKKGDEEREQSLREAANLVNEKVSKYMDSYSDRNINDCIAMTSLELALKAIIQEKDLKRLNEILE
jgi:cell division protein ZapA